MSKRSRGDHAKGANFPHGTGPYDGKHRAVDTPTVDPKGVDGYKPVADRPGHPDGWHEGGR
jgi:hypothetical protein